MIVPRTVPGIIRLKCQEAPNAAAFFVDEATGWRAVTRGEFWADLSRLAGALEKHGIAKSDRIALLIGTRYEWEVADKGIMALGAVCVSIDIKCTTDDIEHILETAEATSIIVENQTLLEKLPARFVASARLVSCIEPIDGAPPTPRFMAWPDLLASASIPFTPDEVTPDDLAAVIFTSGTTGRPKGIQFRQHQLVRGCPIMAQVFAERLDHEHVTISWLPLSNGTGRFINFVSFVLGVKLYFVPDPLQIMDKLKEINPTFMFGVPRFYEKVHDGIVGKLDSAPIWLRVAVRAALSLRQGTRTPVLQRALDPLFIGKIRKAVFGNRIEFMFCGSAPIDPAVLRFFDGLGVSILECYGLSEVAILLAMNRFQDIRVGTVGRPLDGNDLRFTEDGELLVKGDAVFEGYLGLPADGLFDDDGYYGTGDLARLENGYLILTGRKKEIIKTSTGLRISPAEVEQVYARVDLIDQIVVVGNGRRHLAALVTLDPEAVARHREGRVQGAVADGTRDDELHQAVADAMGQLHGRLAANKQIRKFAILPSPFSLDTGELTPTMKLRRAFIEDKYRAEIEQLYATDT